MIISMIYEMIMLTLGVLGCLALFMFVVKTYIQIIEDLKEIGRV